MSSPRFNILVANGVNLHLLGRRQPQIYGHVTLPQIETSLRHSLPDIAQAVGLNKTDVTLNFFQSDDEAAFLKYLDGSWHGVLINPGAWGHTSIALLDCLLALGIPYVEMHLSNIAAREPFRKNTYLAPHASGVVYGFGAHSYAVGLHGLLGRLVSSAK